MYEQDYIMRMIKDLIRFLATIFLKKDKVIYELTYSEKYIRIDLLHRQLVDLIDKGKINEAEDLLFIEIEPGNKKYMELALDFYERLNNLTNEFLESNNYSREEIQEGLKEIAKEFGVNI